MKDAIHLLDCTVLILKQLNYLVGDDAFRAGLHQFLLTHPYGNATWEDLLAAIGTAAHRPLLDWGKQYILRPGMPVLEQHIDVTNGKVRRLTLIQHPEGVAGAFYKRMHRPGKGRPSRKQERVFDEHGRRASTAAAEP